MNTCIRESASSPKSMQVTGFIVLFPIFSSRGLIFLLTTRNDCQNGNGEQTGKRQCACTWISRAICSSQRALENREPLMFRDHGRSTTLKHPATVDVDETWRLPRQCSVNNVYALICAIMHLMLWYSKPRFVSCFNATK